MRRPEWNLGVYVRLLGDVGKADEMTEQRETNWRMRDLWLPAIAAVLLLSTAARLGAQGPEGPGDTISSARPLLDLVELMEQRYATPITYEDPIWEFQGDIETLNDGRGGQFPASRAFKVPPDLMPARNPKLDAAVLGRALAAYHSQTDGPRYKIMTSRLGLHLVPDQVRGSDGAFAPARNALDTVLSIPVTLKTPTEHLADLCAELSRATGAHIQLLGVSGNYTLETIYMPNGHSGGRLSREDLSVAWGAEGISAREALIDLLAPSATSVPWRFVCKAGKECFIVADAIRLPVTMANGEIGWTALFFDRCASCPKLVSPPTPLTRK